MKNKYKNWKVCPNCLNRNSLQTQYKLNTKQNLIKCPQCDLAFLNNMRTDLNNLYNRDDFYSCTEEKYRRNKLGQYSDYSTLKLSIKKNTAFAHNFLINQKYHKNNRILEIGAGLGYFIDIFNKNYFNIEGNEINSAAIAIMREKGITTIEGDILKIKLRTSYKAIVAFDVIEHQIYLDKFLSKINESLCDKGIFILTTPDFFSIFRKLLGKRAPTINHLYHNFYFGKSTLEKILTKSGFKIIYLKTAYIEYISLDRMTFLIAESFPKLRVINSIIKKGNLKSLVIPFVRIGGIRCISQKV